MDKVVELTKSQKDEDKLLVAKVLDKVKMQSRNRFNNTDFLDLSQKAMIEEILNKRKERNYNFFGGYKQAERTILVLFPYSFDDNLDEYEKSKIYSQIISVIRITLPKELKCTYEHKTYLGAIMKLGVKRKKVGDILVNDEGADIVVKKEIEKFLLNNLNSLSRFQKSIVKSINIENINYIEKEKIIFKINVPSMRLDAIVGEIAKVSRNEALDYINQERVFVNFKQELRASKQVDEGSIITIRGKGRFTILRNLGQTRSKRMNIEIQKWN